MSDGRIVIDCIGEVCPMPVIKLAKVADSSPIGTVIEVLSDDDGAKVDIPVWCRMKGHDFIGREDRASGWAFVLRTA